MADLLEDLLARFETMPAEDLAELTKTTLEATAGMKWIPSPGPQTDAYFSEADVLFYGGSGGGGKTDLLSGLALTAHKRTLLMRRQYTDLGAIIERVREIDGTYKGFNGSPPPKLKTSDGRLIDFGAAMKLGDERHWQGQAHDLLAIDEVVHFLEAQIRFVMGWVRTTEKGQRTRTVFASNPPDTADGDWVIGMFRPWLDDTHHNPAKPGELRFYVTDPDGKDLEVDGPELYQFPDGKDPVIPHSRTFIPARLDDNPFLRDSGYKATLDALQGDLRAAVRDGDFMAARMDNPAQMIPTAWIRAAMKRWTKHPPPVPMSCIAVDPSAGGKDKTTISSRYDGWFSEIIELPGREVPLGKEIAGLVIIHRCDGAPVVIDMGGGYGGVPYTVLQDNGIEPIAHKGVETSNARSADRKMGFFNKRTEIWWRFMEALDPDQKGGSGVDLPDDQELLSDLTSVRFTRLQYKGVLTIKAETKEDVVKRLGRSPDKGDAVTMCWSRGDATVLGQNIPRDQRIGGRMGKAPKVVTSKTRVKRKKR